MGLNLMNVFCKYFYAKLTALGVGFTGKLLLFTVGGEFAKV